MPSTLSDYRVFFQQFRRNYHSTGAIAPSGRWLCQALVRYAAPSDQPRRILEVGPGTGAVTQRLVPRLGADDTLDLVELNGEFVQHLRRRFEQEPVLTAVFPRTRILHQRVEELPDESAYDLIVSGLPLNNFSAPDVELILQTFRRLLKPGGTLSFFQYVAIRTARAMVSGAADRRRLKEIGLVLNDVLQRSQVRRDLVWPNIPPAWVHHVRFSDG